MERSANCGGKTEERVWPKVMIVSPTIIYFFIPFVFIIEILKEQEK